MTEGNERNVPRLLRLGLGFLLLLSLAAVFIWSGWTKMLTLEPFAWSFIDLFPVGFTGASILAHLAIGLEWMIAGWLILHVFLKKLTYPATLTILGLFSIYLVGLIIAYGNKGNCGCFGEWAYMKPATALLKNGVLIMVTLLLWKIYPGKAYNGQLYALLLVAVVAFTLPFVLSRVPIYDDAQKMNRPIDLEPLFTYGTPVPSPELKKGKHVFLFFSTTCPHCKKGAYLTQILHRRYPELPLFMILNGNDTLKNSFIQETKSGEIPQTLISYTPAFQKMAGEYVPAIFWVNNGIIERETFYTNLDPAAIKAWLAER
jgi:hypothetical protein